jgi:hypothetical protein
MIAVKPGKRALSTIERAVSELNLIAWHFLRPIRVQKHLNECLQKEGAHNELTAVPA